MDTVNNKLITLIIPVYNTPKESLEALFATISNQTCKEFELLVVDDGSDEKTADLIDDLIRKMGFGIILRKKNEGVSIARNLGIRHCVTKYVTFVDADDLLNENFIEHAIDYLKKYDPDLLIGEIRYVSKSNNINSARQSNDKVEIYQGRESIYELKKALLDVKPREINYRILGTPCGRCYRTSIVKKVWFDEKLSFYEDQIFNRNFFDKAQRIIVVPEIWYFYVQNEFSAMHSNRNHNFYEKVKKYLDVLFLKNCYEETEIRNSLRILSLDFFYGVVNFDYIERDISLGQVQKELQEICKHPLFEDVKKYKYDRKNEIRLIDMINIVLIKFNAFWLIYLEKKFNNKFLKRKEC